MPYKGNKGAQKDVNYPSKDTKASNRLSVHSSSKFLVNDAIRGSNFKDWQKSTLLVVGHDYPTIYDEVTSGIELTLQEAINQLNVLYPKEEAEDVDDIMIPDSEAAILNTLSPAELPSWKFSLFFALLLSHITRILRCRKKCTIR
jgi:hypothetical protein